MIASRPPSPVAPLPSQLLSIALTGNIASGKSTVANRLASHGLRIIDADLLARAVVEPGTPALAEIVARWGRSVVDESGALDRAALRRLVFSDSTELEALNAIVHPRIEERRLALLEEARIRGERLVVSDIPLLFEKEMESRFDLVVLVDAPRDLRHERLVATRGLTIREAEQMIDAQIPAEGKRARADLVIDNEGSLAQLMTRTDELHLELHRRAATTA